LRNRLRRILPERVLGRPQTTIAVLSAATAPVRTAPRRSPARPASHPALPRRAAPQRPPAPYP
jgi:hypothetical protein